MDNLRQQQLESLYQQLNKGVSMKMTMSKLAERYGLEIVSSQDELLLDDYDRGQYGPAISKRRYNKIQDEIRDSVIERPKYFVYLWTDISSYEYWCKQQEEPNYIQLSVKVLDLNLSEGDLATLAADISTLKRLQSKLSTEEMCA